MKRSPLTRRAPLNRAGSLRRHWPKPIEAFVAAMWRDGLDEERCVVCGTRDGLEGHHVIPRRVLVWHHLEAYLVDRRNRAPVCRGDHESHECAHRRISRDELPASVFEFAEEIGLGWYLDRHYPACVCGEINMRHCAVHGHGVAV